VIYFCSFVILGWNDHDQLPGIHSSALKERVERNNPTRLDVYTIVTSSCESERTEDRGVGNAVSASV
jgi:hypothetical protein